MPQDTRSKLDLTQAGDKAIFDNIIIALQEGDFTEFTKAIHATPRDKRLGSKLQLKILIEAAKNAGLFKEVYNAHYKREGTKSSLFVKQNSAGESPLSVAVSRQNTELVKFMFEQFIADKALWPFDNTYTFSEKDAVIAAAYRAAVESGDLELVKAFQPGVRYCDGNLRNSTTGEIICDRRNSPLGGRWTRYWQEICLTPETVVVKTALTIAVDKAGTAKTEETTAKALAVVKYLVEEILGVGYYSSANLLTVLTRAKGYYSDTAVCEYLASVYQPAIESGRVKTPDSSDERTEVKDPYGQRYVASIAAGGAGGDRVRG